MKHLRSPSAWTPLLVSSLAPGVTGCAVVEGIFKTGVWVGVLSVFAVLALIGWVVKRMLT
jgi:hypothetical protein